MSILAQFPCSNGGLRPTARLKKVFKTGKATPTTQIYFSITPSQKKYQRIFQDFKTTFAVSFAGMYKIKKKRRILRFFFPFASNEFKI